MPQRRNDETGEYEIVYSDESVLEVLRGTRLSTSEVADKLDCHRTTAHDRLTTLREEGLVSSTKVGNTYIWEIDC